MVPRGLEPRTLRLLAVRSNQLSYETLVICRARNLLSSRKSRRGIFCGVGGCSVLQQGGPPPPLPCPKKCEVAAPAETAMEQQLGIFGAGERGGWAL